MAFTELRAAAQQALEALEAIREADTAGATPKMVVEARKMYEPTITALRAALVEDAMQKFTDVNQEIEAALAEPAQEPVAWMDIDSDGNRLSVRQWSDGNRDEVPLYTASPQRKPLTDEIIAELWHQNGGFHHHFARAIERWLKGNP